MVDWKSERVTPAQLRTQAEEHTLQVAIYAKAAHSAPGQQPLVSLCFLTAAGRIWNYNQASLDEALRLAFQIDSVPRPLD